MRDFENMPQVQRALELAAEVQRGMLPQSIPAVPGYSLRVWWEPDLPVGGDLYDFHILPTGEILVLAADVAGKGPAAAMGMASLAGIVPIVLEQTGADLPRFFRALNKSVFRWASRVDRFVTLIAIALDASAHRLHQVNAAHRAAYIRRRNGMVANLCADEQMALPLGVKDEYPYREIVSTLGPGDAIVIASDAIENATNSSGEYYGLSRLTKVVALTEPEATKLGDAILADVTAFTGGLPMRDDLLLICFARDNCDAGDVRSVQSMTAPPERATAYQYDADGQLLQSAGGGSY